MAKINRVICILFFVALYSSCKKPVTYTDYQHKAFKQLETIVANSKSDLSDYLHSTKEHAASITKDELMTSFFWTKKNYYALQKDTLLPGVVVEKIEALKLHIQNHYLLHYLNFYDILFVDISGDIFYTIRKQRDYHQNIFEGDLANTILSKKLRNYTGESYVDFQFYDVSGEPSAFFIEPVFKNDKLQGWFVLQCATDKINTLFSNNEALGKTGEVLLVNKAHYLLTNSRFRPHTTILKQKLPDDNIEGKFKAQKGNKTVFDYRGKEALSAFEVFSFFETEWLIIAKMDMDECKANYYVENKSLLYPRLIDSLTSRKTYYNEAFLTNVPLVNIDMDEFARSDSSEILFTQGVSTCTAIAISYPEKFSYMAHISPYDNIYNEERTDILGQLIKQLDYFEITESEKKQMHFTVISTQHNSFEKIIDMILSEGYFLSQITLAYNDCAEYANIYQTSGSVETIINWKIKNQGFRSQKCNRSYTLNELCFVSDPS